MNYGKQELGSLSVTKTSVIKTCNRAVLPLFCRLQEIWPNRLQEKKPFFSVFIFVTAWLSSRLLGYKKYSTNQNYKSSTLYGYVRTFFCNPTKLVDYCLRL